MSEPKHVKNFMYPLMKDIFIRYLSRKHHKPYNKITPSEMSEKDIKLWQEVEAMNGVKVGVTLKRRLH